jgi:hypothetical protein
MSAFLAISLLTKIIGAAEAFNTDKLSVQESVKDSGLKANEQAVKEPGNTYSVVVQHLRMIYGFSMRQTNINDKSRIVPRFCGIAI